MQESFANSASRHLQDAQILSQTQRWDNAVYLAGYVVECAFKILVEQYFGGGTSAVKNYGHNLTELEGKTMERLRVLYPLLDGQLPVSRINGTILAQYHPERRYAKSGVWIESEAKLAVQRAAEIYQETIIKLVLDGSISSKDIKDI